MGRVIGWWPLGLAMWLVVVCGKSTHADFCPSERKVAIRGPPPLPDFEAIFSRTLAKVASLRTLHQELKVNYSISQGDGAFDCLYETYGSITEFNAQRCELRKDLNELCQETTVAPTTEGPTTEAVATTQQIVTTRPTPSTTTSTTTTTRTTTTARTITTTTMQSSSTSKQSTTSTQSSSTQTTTGATKSASTTLPTTTTMDSGVDADNDTTMIEPEVIPTAQPVTSSNEDYIYVIVGVAAGLVVTSCVMAVTIYCCMKRCTKGQVGFGRQKSDMVPIADETLPSTPGTPHSQASFRGVNENVVDISDDFHYNTLRAIHHSKALNRGGFGESSTDQTLDRKSLKRRGESNNNSGQTSPDEIRDDTIDRSTMKQGVSYVTYDNPYVHTPSSSFDATSVDVLVRDSSSPSPPTSTSSPVHRIRSTAKDVPDSGLVLKVDSLPARETNGTNDSLVNLSNEHLFSFPNFQDSKPTTATEGALAPPDEFRDPSISGSMQDLSGKTLSIANEIPVDSKKIAQYPPAVNGGYVNSGFVPDEETLRRKLKERASSPKIQKQNPTKELPKSNPASVKLVNEHNEKNHLVNGYDNKTYQASDSQDSLTKIGYVKPSVKQLAGKFEVPPDRFNSLPNLKKQRGKAREEKLAKKWIPLEENKSYQTDYATLPKKLKVVNGSVPNGRIRHDSNDSWVESGSKPAARVPPFERNPSAKCADIHL